MLKKIVILIFVIITFSCDEFNESLKLNKNINQVENNSTPTAPLSEELTTNSNINKNIESIETEYSYDFNILDQDLFFNDLKDIKLPKSSFGIIIEDDAKFYPLTDLTNNSDLENIKNGKSIPLGNYVDIIDVVKNLNNSDNLFNYKGSNNYFYKVLYKEELGLVWGNNLLLDFKNYEEAKKLVYFYKNSITQRDFLTFNGKYSFTENQLKSLNDNRITFSEVDPSSIKLDIESPDEMVSLYKSDSNYRDNSMFITTDFILHTSHLIYNNFLQGMEEDKFNSKIELFINSILKDISLKVEKYDSSEDLLNVYNTLYDYFKVADVILNYNRDNTDFSINLLDENENVQKELTLILNSDGVSKSPILGKEIDYSIFELKGHYNKSRELNAYFLCMSWLSKIEFEFSYNDINSTKLVLAISQIVSKNSKIYNQWEEVYTPYSYFIGKSESLSFNNTEDFLSSYSIRNFNKLLSDTDQVVEFLDKNLDSININSLADPGFSIFGFRSELYKFVFSQTSAPIIKKREFPRGLDLISVLGSQSGFSLLRQIEGKEEYWSELSSSIYLLQDLTNVEDSDYWTKSLYYRYIELISSVANFEQSREFYFTLKPKWNQKVLNSVHGAWSEMDHDRVIYSKKGTPIKNENSSNTRDIYAYEKPYSYIEPNLEFFKILEKTVDETINYIRTYNLENSDFDDLITLLETLSRLREIVEKEISGETITNNDNNYINNIPNVFSKLILPYNISNGDYLNNKEDLKMPLISSRFENSTSGDLLESGIGIPLRMHILLNDESGGKRVATGYTYSYYEFIREQSNEISNAKWKEMVYNSSNEISDLKPFWANPKLK